MGWRDDSFLTSPCSFLAFFFFSPCGNTKKGNVPAELHNNEATSSYLKKQLEAKKKLKSYQSMQKVTLIEEWMQESVHDKNLKTQL